MKRRFWWLLLVVALGVALGAWWQQRQSARPAAPAVPQTLATPASAPVPAAKPVVPIQDRKTIDFSSGRPVVKDTPADRAALAQAEQEIAEAIKGVTFPPTKKPAPAADSNKAEPVPAPPKR